MKEAMKKFLDKILKLPPVEQRPDIRRSLFKTVVMATHEKDDTYLYYLCNVWCFRLFFCSLVVFFLHFSLLDDGKVSDHFQVFLYQYNQFIFILGLLFIFPFFLLKFLWNINPKKYDILWAAPSYKAHSTRSKKKIIPRTLILAGALVVILKFGYMFPQSPYIKPFISENSLVGFLLISTFLSWILSVCWAFLLMLVMILWRYVGSHEGY